MATVTRWVKLTRWVHCDHDPLGQSGQNEADSPDFPLRRIHF